MDYNSAVIAAWVAQIDAAKVRVQGMLIHNLIEQESGAQRYYTQDAFEKEVTFINDLASSIMARAEGL